MGFDFSGHDKPVNLSIPPDTWHLFHVGKVEQKWSQSGTQYYNLTLNYADPESHLCGDTAFLALFPHDKGGAPDRGFIRTAGALLIATGTMTAEELNKSIPAEIEWLEGRQFVAMFSAGKKDPDKTYLRFVSGAERAKGWPEINGLALTTAARYREAQQFEVGGSAPRPLSAPPAPYTPPPAAPAPPAPQPSPFAPRQPQPPAVNPNDIVI
jgi:hypothetical protein